MRAPLYVCVRVIQRVELILMARFLQIDFALCAMCVCASVCVSARERNFDGGDACSNITNLPGPAR